MKKIIPYPETKRFDRQGNVIGYITTVMSYPHKTQELKQRFVNLVKALTYSALTNHHANKKILAFYALFLIIGVGFYVLIS